MRFTALLAPLILVAATSAQQLTPATPAEIIVPEPSAADRLKSLEATLANLKAEFAKLQEVEKSGGLAARVKSALAERSLAIDTIEDPNPPTAVATDPAGTATATAARLLTDDEKSALGADVIFTVDGQAATKAELDSALEYLNSYPSSRTPDQLKKQAVLELIRLKAAVAAFPDTEPKAHAKIMELQAELEHGHEFAEIAREHSDCPSSQRGGDLGKFGRVGMDFWFTKAAYDLKVGDVSKVVPTTFGYHLIKVTGIEKGATANEDKVQASHILALYTPDQARISNVSQRVHAGKAELAFASEEYLALAPDMYR